uniref:Uncharacterized protein n=1 Tax=Meloidogyne enterolobii TaxID=390850 RepID=A0A6V7XK92_MELEN|nr:unnamed protein product [Meloidogyne enterolobii]
MQGIYGGQKDKRERKAKGIAYSSAPLPKLPFSLTELTFLTEILDNIINNINNNTNLIDIIGNGSINQAKYPQVNLHQLIPNFNLKLKPILNYYYNILHAQQQRVPETIIKTTKDLFVVWHLFGVARSLISSFLLQHPMKISVFSYIKAFDELEVKAKTLLGWLRTLNVLQGAAIQFGHKGFYYTRPTMLMSLQEAENHVNVIYPVEFEHVANINIFPFANFLINIGDLYNPKLTYEECQNINNILGIQGNIGFYTLYNQVQEIVKRKIDILIGQNLIELFIGNKEYLPENSENLPNRFNFVMKIREECENRIIQNFDLNVAAIDEE